MLDKPVYRWSVIKGSVTGASHLRNGSESDNQDAIESCVGDDDGPPVVLAVSDGHGSPKNFRSNVGSKLAVQVSVQITTEFLDKVKALSVSEIKRAAERHLTADLIREWRQRVKEHFDREPFEVSAEGQEYLAYGATLLLVAIGAGFVFYLQLGDGDIRAVSGETKQVEHPLPPDPTLIANETTSLCMKDAHKLFRFAFQNTQNGPPALILASSDGYSNSFSTPGAFDQVASDLLRIIHDEDDGWTRIEQQLEGWLTEASQKGSGDDVSLGIICRQDLIRTGGGTGLGPEEESPSENDRERDVRLGPR
jgi:hypothetical protein